MQLKRNNKKLLILVGVLLLFGGVSLAYFASKVLSNGNGASTEGTTALIKGATINIEGILEFNDLEIYPGHKGVSSIKVTATGNNELIPYNLIWNGTNTLTTPLNFTIYKTSEQIEVKSTCKTKTEYIGSGKALSEECEISNIDKLGSEIATGTINKDEEKVILAKDEFITAVNGGQTVYYYIILEYPNLDEPQNYDLEGTLEGKVTVEESDKKPDINIIAAYIEQEDGTYKDVEDIPQEGYALNREKSTCSNGAIPTGFTPNITINNLSKSGTSCYLYFYKSVASTVILATGELVNENGYRYEGKNPNNYILFNNELWRIIGVFDVQTESENTESLVKIIRDEKIGDYVWYSSYNICYNNWSTANLKILLNEGDYYNRSGSYSSNGLTSGAKNMIESVVWNLGGAYVTTADTMYNDERGTEVYSGNPTTWTGQVGLMYPSDYGYASPANMCIRTTVISQYRDVSSCKDNNWLLKSYNQWMITHYRYANNFAFELYSDGNVINNAYTNVNIGVRPSLYLKSSVKITGGNGSQSNSYIMQ